MTRAAAVAVVCSAAGAALVVAGVAVVFWPAALVLAGVALLAAGLFGFDVTGRGDRRTR